MQISRKYGLQRSPKLVEMIAAVPEEHRAILLPQLRAKPVRTASGIAVVAVMSKPHRCPHIATTGALQLQVVGGECPVALVLSWVCWLLSAELAFCMDCSRLLRCCNLAVEASRLRRTSSQCIVSSSQPPLAVQAP